MAQPNEDLALVFVFMSPVGSIDGVRFDEVLSAVNVDYSKLRRRVFLSFFFFLWFPVVFTPFSVVTEFFFQLPIIMTQRSIDYYLILQSYTTNLVIAKKIRLLPEYFYPPCMITGFYWVFQLIDSTGWLAQGIIPFLTNFLPNRSEIQAVFVFFYWIIC